MRRACLVALVFAASATAGSACSIVEGWDVEWPQKGVDIRGTVAGYVGPVPEPGSKEIGWALRITKLDDGEEKSLDGETTVFPRTLDGACFWTPFPSLELIETRFPMGTFVSAVVTEIPKDRHVVAGKVETWYGPRHTILPKDCRLWEQILSSPYRVRWFVRRLHERETDAERSALFDPLLACTQEFDWKYFLRFTLRDKELRRNTLFKWCRLHGVEIPQSVMQAPISELDF